MKFDPTTTRHHAYVKEQTRGTLVEPLAEKLAESAKPCVRYDVTEGTTTSFLGGDPILNDGTEWPVGKDGFPLSFLGELDLADGGPLTRTYGFPDTGWLAFFQAAHGEVWGDVSQRTEWRVIYVSKDKPFSIRSQPTELTDEITAEKYEYAYPASFPRVYLQPSFDLSFDPRIFYDMFQEHDETAIQAVGDYVHRENVQLFGWGHPIQNPVEEEIGYWLKDSPLKESKWAMVAQIPSIHEAQMMWGDVGILYFLTTKDMLEREAWNEMWMIMQCS